MAAHFAPGLPETTKAAAEPTGVPALMAVAENLYRGTDPAAPGEQGPPLLQVRRTAGSGTSPDSEFELVLRLPGAADANFELLCRGAVRRTYGRYGDFNAREPARRRAHLQRGGEGPDSGGPTVGAGYVPARRVGRD